MLRKRREEEEKVELVTDEKFGKRSFLGSRDFLSAESGEKLPDSLLLAH